MALSIAATALLFAFVPFTRPAAPPPLGHGDGYGEKKQIVRLNPPIDFSSAALSWCESRAGLGQALRQLQQHHPTQRFSSFCFLALPASGVAALPAGLFRRLRLCRGEQSNRYSPEVFPNASPIRAGPDAASAFRLRF